MNGQVVFVGVAVIPKQSGMYYAVAAAQWLILPPTLVKVVLPVGVALVAFAMPFFEVPCAKSAASLILVVQIVLSVCSYVPAWHAKWSVRSKSVVTNSMESSNFVSVPKTVCETVGGTVGGTACGIAVKLSVETAAWETAVQEIVAHEIAAQQTAAQQTAAWKTAARETAALATAFELTEVNTLQKN